MRKAKAVPASRAVETVYRTSLYRLIYRSWSRIAKNPDAGIEDLIEQIGLPAVARMVADADRSHARRIAAAIEAIGVVQQQRAAIADVGSIMAARTAQNVELIRNVTDQQRLLAAVEIGRVDADAPLATRLEAALGTSRARARLIARDQVGKFNSELTEVRAQAAGSPSYEWSTSGDERVRATHIELDGNVYRWDEPTGAEDGLQPGQPILCRCVSLALFD